MTTPKKESTINALEGYIQANKVVLLTDYRGLPAADLDSLRGRLKEANATFRIAKNTLLGIAADRTGIDGLGPLLKGPTALALGPDNGAEVAKAILDFIRTSRSSLQVKGGVVEGRVITADQVTILATLPPKHDLQATLAGAIQGPLSGLVGVMNSALSQLAYVLAEREKQLGGSEA